MTIQCPRCKQINPPQARFCLNCGLARPVPSTPAQPTAQSPSRAVDKVPKKSWLGSWLLLFAIVGGLAFACALFGIIGSELKKKGESANQTQIANTVDNSTPAPTPTPAPKTFAQLKTEADNLLAIQQSEYEGADLKNFDEVMTPLSEIPKDSKDYKSAQQLHKKVMEKASVIVAERVLLGEKPLQSSWDGSVLPVKTYLKAVLNDYDSSEFVEWSPVSKVYIGKEPYWGVRLRLRAKNAFGALILRDTYYYMRHNNVVIAKGLG